MGNLSHVGSIIFVGFQPMVIACPSDPLINPRPVSKNFRWPGRAQSPGSGSNCLGVFFLSPLLRRLSPFHRELCMSNMDTPSLMSFGMTNACKSQQSSALGGCRLAFFLSGLEPEDSQHFLFCNQHGLPETIFGVQKLERHRLASWSFLSLHHDLFRSHASGPWKKAKQTYAQ